MERKPFVAVLGPHGAGKTTLVNALLEGLLVAAGCDDTAGTHVVEEERVEPGDADAAGGGGAPAPLEAPYPERFFDTTRRTSLTSLSFDCAGAVLPVGRGSLVPVVVARAAGATWCAAVPSAAFRVVCRVPYRTEAEVVDALTTAEKLVAGSGRDVDMMSFDGRTAMDVREETRFIVGDVTWHETAPHSEEALCVPQRMRRFLGSVRVYTVEADEPREALERARRWLLSNVFEPETSRSGLIKDWARVELPLDIPLDLVELPGFADGAPVGARVERLLREPNLAALIYVSDGARPPRPCTRTVCDAGVLQRCAALDCRLGLFYPIDKLVPGLADCLDDPPAQVEEMLAEFKQRQRSATSMDPLSWPKLLQAAVGQVPNGCISKLNEQGGIRLLNAATSTLKWPGGIRRYGSAIVMDYLQFVAKSVTIEQPALAAEPLLVQPAAAEPVSDIAEDVTEEKTTDALATDASLRRDSTSTDGSDVDALKTAVAIAGAVATGVDDTAPLPSVGTASGTPWMCLGDSRDSLGSDVGGVATARALDALDVSRGQTRGSAAALEGTSGEQLPAVDAVMEVAAFIDEEEVKEAAPNIVVTPEESTVALATVVQPLSPANPPAPQPVDSLADVESSPAAPKTASARAGSAARLLLRGSARSRSTARTTGAATNQEQDSRPKRARHAPTEWWKGGSYSWEGGDNLPAVVTMRTRASKRRRSTG